MSGTIHLGYVVGTGEPVEIPLRHTAVTGQTQESGKTTTLEGLISRSGLQAVAYVTKRGESSFHVMNPIPPYFQERADWKFVQSLLEASTESKLKFEQSWIMRASEGARTLKDVQANIQRFLHGVRDTHQVKQRKGAEPKERWTQKPARGLSGDIYYVLNKYLDDVMPQLASMPYSTKLDLARGLNVMDLRDYEFPLQALVVRSVIDWIRTHGEDIITVIPEAWKFAPKQKGSPVRQSAEELIREGGALKNFLWVDSQDLAGVADVLMRQIGVWIFGVQRARHEIERALDHMPEGLPARRPRPADIATLSKGQFYVCFGREMHKVYVQPAWMSAAHAEAIARGEEEVDSAREILKQYDKGSKHASRNLAPVATTHTRREIEENIAQSEMVAVPGVQQQAVETGRSDSAPDRRAQRSDDSASGASSETGDEAMWKEKYETLKLEHDALVKRIENGYIVKADPGAPASTSIPVLAANGNLDDFYAHIKARLLAEDKPALLQLLVNQPELSVEIKRNIIKAEDSTIFGRTARLIKDGFFKEPKTSQDVFRELVRVGHLSPKAVKLGGKVGQDVSKLAELGFLTLEGNGYQAVAGMKVNIVEA